ncbi:MAG: aldo/keto reductase [Novosphingobium sp.]|nr:aldo/keto reductase [Novosphingobium sp.]
MEYRTLGTSGIVVSVFGLGVMTFGGQTPQDDAMRQLDMAWDAGITLFDTAENYPIPTGPETQGRSEEILGQWARCRGLRSRVVIATKVAGPGNAAGDMSHISGPQRRLDRANIRQAAEASLKRPGTDYIDLYETHWPERAMTTLWRSRFSAIPDDPAQVAIEETFDALTELVHEGKIRAIGLCNESPWGLMRHVALAEHGRGPRPASLQIGYSLLDRQMEIGHAEVLMRERIGMLGYSPLARGLLTGKHLAGGTHPMLTPGRRAAIEACVALARQAGLDPVHMALAFAAARPFMTSVLIAASCVRQLQHNIAAAGLTLPRNLSQAIDAIHDANANPR